MATLGRNISFPIKNADDSSFHGLVLRKATVDSVVMSLGDKITGDAYYKNNHLECTMQEYVEYNDVKYTLVNPPTIVREGLVSDNSDLKGLTKYSFEFYHPMYILANLPFSDVAVSDDEKRYLSENKTFNWIGKPQDYIDKINKNLEGTEWIVVKSGSFPEEKDDELSEVLSFDNNTIADSLKTGYETWGLPYVVSQIKSGEQYYSNGKRFKVEFGLPSNEIVVNNENFVFQFGKDVGLKNNSRTPRNNKIITRIAGYGSENNIPYGYPQIRWYGNPNWKYTINSNSADPNSYPIYDGIVGGAVVKLIKHPFTRTHLMPSVYSESVFNKVSPYLSDGSTNPNYNPDIELVDYYDAVSTQDWQYVNEINLLAPSYESHEFDIKPEMDDGQSNVTILGATPLNDDLTPASGWDDSIDDDGNYVQSYFQLTLPTLSFDLYACAAITEEMQVNMRSGACLGCTFTVYVDWEDYKSNFYDSDGNFLPNGEQRDLTKYPKSNLGSINIVVQKDTNTFGTLMPNRYQYPSNGNEFVVLGISLPQEYITNAEQRLDDEMKSYMLENNVYYYDYPLKFDEAFLYNHTDILEQIRPNTVIRFGFGGNAEPLSLFVKQLTIKYGEGVLPQYDITLTDNIEIVLNQLGQVADSVEKLGSLVAVLRQTYNRNIWSELEKKLSKVKNDSTPYKIGVGELEVDRNATIHGNSSVNGNESVGGNQTVSGTSRLQGDVFFGKPTGDGVEHNQVLRSTLYNAGFAGWNIDEYGNLEVASLKVRDYLEVDELRINRLQAQEGDTIFTDNDQIEDITEGDDSTYILTFKEKWEGYFTAQRYGNILKGIINTLAANYVAEREGRLPVVDPESAEWEEQQYDAGNNKYFTSWMYVVADRNTDNTLGLNQVRVALFPDNEIAQDKNFAPCIDMVVGRWGCLNYETENASELASIKQRQSFFYISTSEGRLMKLNSVSSPILEEGNFGTVLGNIPDFIRQWGSWERLLREHPHLADRDYLYAQGLIYSDLIKVDIKGAPVPVTVHCGDWVDGNTASGTWTDEYGDTVNLPAPKHGIYYNTSWNVKSQQFETHTVRHKSGTWVCLISQPVVVGGVSTYHEPAWNSLYWRLVDGNENYTIEFVSSNGDKFRVGDVQTTVTPHLYIGNVDITSDISDSYWSWTRISQNGQAATAADAVWDSNHTTTRVLSLTNDDMPVGWTRGWKTVFTCTVVVNDGRTTRIVDNQVIV